MREKRRVHLAQTATESLAYTRLSVSTPHPHLHTHSDEDNALPDGRRALVNPDNIRVVELPRPPASATVQQLRFPKNVGLQLRPYNPSTYNEEEEMKELAAKGQETASESLIRWRFKRDASGVVQRDAATGQPLVTMNNTLRWGNTHRCALPCPPSLSVKATPSLWNGPMAHCSCSSARKPLTCASSTSPSAT